MCVCFFFAHPVHYLRRFLYPSPSLHVTQTRGQIAGSSPPCPLRYAPFNLSRQDSSNLFPRRLAIELLSVKHITRASRPCRIMYKIILATDPSMKKKNIYIPLTCTECLISVWVMRTIHKIDHQAASDLSCVEKATALIAENPRYIPFFDACYGRGIKVYLFWAEKCFLMTGRSSLTQNRREKKSFFAMMILIIHLGHAYGILHPVPVLLVLQSHFLAQVGHVILSSESEEPPPQKKKKKHGETSIVSTRVVYF